MSAPAGDRMMTTRPRLTWARLDGMDWPAPQQEFTQYNTRVRETLWLEVYSGGGVELYCRARFTGAEAAVQMTNDVEMQLEHVYPADSIADHFGYTNRSCRTPTPGVAAADTDAGLCKAAAADLYNLFPAYAPMNQSRSNLAYAELDGEGTTNPNYSDICDDFERGRIDEETYVEPADSARGDIARAILYMHYVYGLPFEYVIADQELLLRWANDDPPDQQELRREQRIRRHQTESWNPLVAPRDVAS